MRNVTRVLVVTAGTTGLGATALGIAQVCTRDGFETILVDTAQEVPAVTGAAPEGLAVGTDLQAAATRADLVIETSPEQLDAKQSLVRQLDAWCPPDVLLAVNTGQHRIAQVAERCTHPDRVVGIHWPDDPLTIPLVEIVPSDQSAPAAIEAAEHFVQACDRQFVVVHKDVPGFIYNRLRMAMLIEAARLVDEGVSSAEDVDRVALGMYRHPVGPMRTLELIGADNVALAATTMADYYQDDRFAAPPLLAEMVARSQRRTALLWPQCSKEEFSG
jgi:3-hydroxybutyryl-CoA dehydrogenase